MRLLRGNYYVSAVVFVRFSCVEWSILINPAMVVIAYCYDAHRIFVYRCDNVAVASMDHYDGFIARYGTLYRSRYRPFRSVGVCVSLRTEDVFRAVYVGFPGVPR